MFIHTEEGIGIVLMLKNNSPIKPFDSILTTDQISTVVLKINPDTLTYSFMGGVHKLGKKEEEEYKYFLKYSNIYTLSKDLTLESIATEFIKNNFDEIEPYAKEWGWEEATSIDNAIKSLEKPHLLSWVVAEVMSWNRFGQEIYKYMLPDEDVFTLLIGGVEYTWDLNEHVLKKS